MRCPLCEISLKPAVINGHPVLRCGICQGVAQGSQWFNPGDFEKNVTPNSTPSPTPTSELDRELALAKVALMQEQHRQKQESKPASAQLLKNPVMLAGLPAKDAAHAATIFPVVTFSLVLVCVLIQLLTQHAAEAWGFLTSEPFRHGGLTFVTSFFLHGGWWHLISNMWFLWIFGGNVEEELGTGSYLKLIFTAHIAGNLLLWALPAKAPTLVVGASGGIAAVIAFYVLAFPKHRISTLWFFRVQRWPAWLWGLFYFAMQIPGAIQQIYFKGGGISFVSHLAGFATGALAYWKFRPHRDS